MTAPIRFTNGSKESFIEKLSKRPAGRPRGTKTVPVATPGSLPGGSNETMFSGGMVTLVGDYVPYRNRFEQLDADQKARCGPVSVFEGCKAQIEQVGEAPRRLVVDHSVPDFYVPAQTGARVDELGGYEDEIGGRPFYARDMEVVDPDAYELEPVIIHLAALGLSHTDGEDCREFLDEFSLMHRR